jgi:trk system potassium uptake protein TrkA
MKRIGIIGAGRFGYSLAETLASHGAEVLLIDQDREKIQTLSEFVTKAIEGDVTNIRTLQDAGYAECDVVVIAIGSNLEGSIMATVHCKKLEVPLVVAKANSDVHGEILRRVGADKVIYPNRDCAKNLARTLLSKGNVDLFAISDDFNIAEIDVPDSIKNKTLLEANVRKQFGVTVLCVRRLAADPENPRTVIIPTADDIILPEDKLLVFGPIKKIDIIAQEAQ